MQAATSKAPAAAAESPSSKKGGLNLAAHTYEQVTAARGERWAECTIKALQQKERTQAAQIVQLKRELETAKAQLATDRAAAANKQKKSDEPNEQQRAEALEAAAAAAAAEAAAAASSSAAAAAAAADPPSEALIAQLQELGLDRRGALRALRETGGGSVAAAADWYFANYTPDAQPARPADDVSWLLG